MGCRGQGYLPPLPRPASPNHVAMCCISIHSLLTAVISWPLGRQTNQKSSCYYTHDLLNWEHQQQTKQNKLAEMWEARNQ